jgi:hypothetical protein
MAPLNSLGDVAALPPAVTPAQLTVMYGGDSEAFSLLCVAHAVLPRVPRGVGAWLQLPENCAGWVQTLTYHAGTHQLAWWMKSRQLGADHPDTLQAARNMRAIRRDLKEAKRILNGQVSPRRWSSAESFAMDRLLEVHRDEADQMIAALRVSSGIDQVDQLNPAVVRLLDMGDEAFRTLVAREVQGRAAVGALGHPRVLGRWREALEELGRMTFSELGLDATQTDVSRLFVVADSYLAAVPDGEVDEFIRRLVFLNHLRKRMAQRGRLRKKFNQRLSRQVFVPVEESLRDRYFLEYSQYRLEAPPAHVHVGPRHDPGPAKFTMYKAVLKRAGWSTEVVFNGRRMWVVASREERRLIVTASLKGANGLSRNRKWRPPVFVEYDPASGRYFQLASWKALEEVASAETASPRPTGKVMPQTEAITQMVTPSAEESA